MREGGSGLSLLFLAFALFGTVAVSVAEGATVTVVDLDGPGEGFNDATPVAPVGGNPGTTLGAQRLNAFQHAADIWGGLISSPVEIRVGANFDPLTCNSTSAILGSAGPSNAFRDFAGAPRSGTWYPVALGNALFGSDLDPGSDDIGATFNSSIGTTCAFPRTWYYGFDGNPSGSEIDFVTVVLHELGHGLGFLTFVDLASGQKMLELDDTFMLNLENHGASPADYPSMTNAQRVAASTATGNLHWVGPSVAAASGVLTSGRVGDHVQMYAPDPQEAGSSVSHWDTALTPDQLMEPVYTGPLHDPDLELPLFQDIGWTLVAVGDIDVQPPSKNYGSVVVGATGDQAFTVTYTGTGTLHVSGTSITNLGAGMSAGEFSILGGVNAFTLAQNESQMVTVRFAPVGSAGARTATLRFTSDDSLTPTRDVGLSGAAQLPVVTIAASDPAASETGPDPGTFTVSRTGPTGAALTVTYSVGGTATADSDYTALPGSLTIPAGASSAPIVVNPIDDTLGEGPETVIVSLSAGAAYTVGSPGSATVTIADNDPIGPDLVVISVTSPPATAAPGTGFSVTDTVKNGGSVAAGSSSSTRYYLSIDTSKGGTDVLLTGSRTVTALAAGAQSSGTVTVTIPAATALDTYHLLACADDTGHVSETNEGNNCTPAAGTVTVTRPDLVVTSLGNPPATALPGGKFTVAETTTNQGTVSAAATTTRFYLSLDTSKGTGDHLLTGTHAVPILAAGAASPKTVSLTIPSTTPLATYFLLACADDLKRVVETSETNNCRASSSTVVVGRPDLIETTISNPPATAVPGASFAVTDTAKNQGPLDAGSSTTRYYLSLNTTKGSGDRLLTGTRAVGSLAPGATSPGTVTVTIPSTTSTGDYFLLACADDLVEVTESDETNNCRASATKVSVSP